MQIYQDFTSEGAKRSIPDIKAIILHHTASEVPTKNIVNFLKKKDYISAHYLVAKTGGIYHLVQDDYSAYHAGVSEWKGLSTKNNSLNWCTIGIEVHSLGSIFTKEQKKATTELVKSLMQKYNIPKELVLRHKDIAPKRKIDIGDSFWNEEFTTFKDYQQSLTTETMTEEQLKALEAITAVNSALWSKLPLEAKKIIENANKELKLFLK